MSDEEHIKVRSELPNIDIRHGRTFSRPKVTLAEFRHPPGDWFQAGMDDIPGWDLKLMFNLGPAVRRNDYWWETGEITR